VTALPVVKGASRVTAVTVLALIFALGASRVARADSGGASWQFAPAQAPPAPSGTTAAPYAVPVGQVGDISFWAPNRGLLITGGTEEGSQGPVASGLYAYNGAEWHQLSTVCGGGAGRIAWAGPDEFWTISDQREGQQLAGENNDPRMFHSLSLCHFLDGQVVGSYAMPLQQPDSYQQMDAAACYGPSDCWFGGQDGQGADVGAFHLHWDGSTVSAVYEPEDHAVADMVNFNGQIYESVRIKSTDTPLPEENLAHPAILHAIAPSGSPLALFSELPIFTDFHHPPVQRLPLYGTGVSPAALEGFSLQTDGSPLGEDATQLWAAANPIEPGDLPAGASKASMTVLRYANNVWSQVFPSASGSSPLPAEVELAGASADVGNVAEVQGAGETIAPEPGSEDAWLSLRSPGEDGAVLALLQSNGAIAETDVLPSSLEPVGFRGSAGPIVCPAPHDCWMATNSAQDPVTNENSVPGWLFHLSDGTHYPLDTDPNFANVITSRPPDSGVPVIYPDVPPVDDSLANQQLQPAPSGPPIQISVPAPGKVKAKALIAHVHSRLVNHRTLVLSFILSAHARVQLIARRGRAVVAKSRAESLSAGRHRLSLSLDPRRWPTGFQFKATPVGGASHPSGGSEEAGSNDTIST
jgi:hypothetical protein